jgi:hypothetical protein
MAREILTFGVWAAAFASRSILWRGRRLRILPGGHIALDDVETGGPSPSGAEGQRL